MDGDSYQGFRVCSANTYPFTSLDKGAGFLQASCWPPSGPTCSCEPSGQHEGGREDERESWTFREGSRMVEAPFGVTSQWAPEPNTAGRKSTSPGDLLCARHCAFILPCRDDFYILPEAAIVSSS